MRSRITFTRNHAGGAITTIYTGVVILVANTTVVLVRGTFTRNTLVRDVMSVISKVGNREAHLTRRPDSRTREGRASRSHEVTFLLRLRCRSHVPNLSSLLPIS